MSEIFIYDDIGPDYYGLVSAKGVIRSLDAVGKGKPVTVRINSPGGDVVEAQGIYNALRRHSADGGKVTVEIDALAASAASYVAMAGDVVRIAENAMFMVHKAWTLAIGNADQIRQTADVLDKFDGILAATYSARTGLDVAEILALLEAETWMGAEESLQRKFADEIGTPLNVAASLPPGRFAKAPDTLVNPALPAKAKERAEKRGRHVEHVQQQLRVARARLGV